MSKAREKYAAECSRKGWGEDEDNRTEKAEQ